MNDNNSSRAENVVEHVRECDVTKLLSGIHNGYTFSQIWPES